MNKLKIGHRLTLAFGVVLLITVFIAILGVFTLEAANAPGQRLLA